MTNEWTRGRGGLAALAGLILVASCGQDATDAPAEPGARAEAVASCDLRYCDQDNDGYGQAGAAVCAGGCGVVPDVESAGDCNDLNANVHPMSGEVGGKDVDNDCDGLVDEATALLGPPYWDGAVNAPPSATSVTSRTSLASGTSVSAWAGVYPHQKAVLDLMAPLTGVFGKVYYRRLDTPSSPYQASEIMPAKIKPNDDGSPIEYAWFSIPGLTPLTAYEYRIDFYKIECTDTSGPLNIKYIRIPPVGCTGDSGSTPPCSSTDVNYLFTPPAGGGRVADARWEIVQEALGLKGRVDVGDATMVGKDAFATNDSGFYATAAMYVEKNFYEFRFKLDASVNDETTLHEWFGQEEYDGALVDDPGPATLDALKPGDCLSVDGPNGSHVRMFLENDDAGRYWYIEGNSRLDTKWGPVYHVPRIASAKRCTSAGDPSCDRVRWVGKLVSDMLGPPL